MKISKTAAAAARRLFGLCQTDGRLDETKMRTVISSISTQKPRDWHAILGAIQRLVRLDLAKREVLIESATALDEITRKRVVSGLENQYGPDLVVSYQTTPDLLGGLRIRVGNDVFDGSVKGRLDRLAAAF